MTTVLFVDQAQEELETKFGKYMKAVIDMTKIDGELAKELIEIAECGAALCDVMGDYLIIYTSLT